MALTREDVAGIADYARIALTDEELDEMTSYMNDAIDLLQPIREYDLEGVEPTFHPIGDLSNVMGEDVIDDSDRALPIDVALKNAPSARDRYFRVPSILGDEEGGDR
ncbi:MAG: Asp-tRNA(Asn)/Glu-tRNA(Gln) amidotransferase subunit GatC [Tractidigestivibacter sp.]|jgi:aspartyl-tRNA(Asn)/glutamyl-tRNA(Gln) amidotransferase subunit C|uniref:Asp-tRNA(Asn)/Glu-tRNA(Gln) amidotransferase subunit GatC n=1 Tax=Tractidigestivibacter sp. TaxID=2847320 RepID=UPI003D9016A1